jgi:hypothetical protein
LPIFQADLRQYFDFASQQICPPGTARSATLHGTSEICAAVFLGVVKNWRKY